MKAFLAFLVVAGTFACVLVPLSRPKGWITAEVVFGGYLVFFSFASLTFFIAKSDIEVDSVGIRALVFNRLLSKEMSWTAVDHIRIARFWSFERHRWAITYEVYRDKKLRPYFFPKGKITFSEYIDNIAELKKFVKIHAEQHGILIEGDTFD